ncbi:L-fucose:H+ symporter permease [Flavihumibacter profundi]|uniref:L-fucose:H+ symporter permease n=1 Tax=Flavihumibacter profundi TaxID=2716883 RepID=UPI001CC4BB0A|nr:L-fucose:H+ symporter permease [Flavihumibacter profundi]MBZ5856428.1 L-fucose:H+ symporter permease [Flavihumibacter profundi]
MKNKNALISPGYLLTFSLVTCLFFLWALPNTMNDVLISHFMKSLELSRLKAGLIQSAFKLGYFTFALPAGLFMQRFGYKHGLVTGLILFALGCFLFWPAAVAGKYIFFLGALFVIASGLAFLELGANSLIVSLGDPNLSERRLNLAQAFNPIGAMTGVAIGTIFIFSGKELSPEQVAEMKTAGTYKAYLAEETMRVGPPYITLGIVVLVFAFILSRVKFPQQETKGEPIVKGSFRELKKYPHWYKAIMAQFFYLGAQLGTWSFFIQYVKENGALREKMAGGFLVGTLAAFMAGRFSSTFFMKYIKPTRLMGFYAIANICLVSVGILFPGWIGIWAIFCTSFFMSVMYPTIFASGVKGLGPNAKLGASFLVMSLIGGAVLTPFMGLIADRTHAIAPAMVIPLFSYFVILYYSFIGSKPAGPLYGL